MPSTRHAPAGRFGLAVLVAVLVPALAGLPAAAASGSVRAGQVPAAVGEVSAVVPPTATATPATAATAATAASPMAAATAPASDVKQPKVRQVRLAGISSSVLSSAPAPDAPAKGAVGTLGLAAPRLKPAVAAGIAIASPAALVAVTADAAFAAGTSIKVRVRERGHGWSDWTTLDLDPDHGPDPGSAEAARSHPGSDPLMTVDATRAQVRIDTPSGKVPAGTRLTLVSSPAAASDAKASARSSLGALSTVGQPTIVSRAQWGADESWRSRGPLYTDNIRLGFIHHTASTSNYTPAQAAAQVRAIYAYHTKSLGHSDIDYNFVIDRFGRIYEGRYGGIDRPVLGGHTAGFNEHTFAAVALGNFQTTAPSAQDMAAIRDSYARLFAWKLGLSGVNPTATVKLVSAGYIKATRYPRGSVATLPAISSHQMVNFTSCPGKYLQAQLPAIRALAGEYSDVVISAPSPPIDAFQSGTRSSVELTSQANRAVTWTADVLSPCSDTPVRSYTGSTSAAGPIQVSWDLRDSAGNPVLPATYTLRVSGTAADGTPVATVESTITISPAPGGQWGPCGNASRVVGTSPAATSVLWGRISAPGSKVVVLTGQADAGAAAFAAGVAAAPLARNLGAPLLMTPGAALADEVAGDIRERGATEVIIVGRSAVVSDAVAGQVAALGVPVTRLAGATDAATAAAVAGRMGPSASAVIVSPSGSPAHAIAGAALAAARGVPVLLAAGDAIGAETQAALAGRTSVSVAASTGLSDATISAALGSITWDRLTGADAVSASLAVASAFPGTPESAMVLPEAAGAWATAPVAAAAAVPLLITTSPVLATGVADFLRARPAMRATTTPVSSMWLDDQVLGATSRVLLGLPWAPPGVTTPGGKGPTATGTRKVGTANASPEPVRKGRTLKVTSRVRSKYTDGKYRAVAPGIAFSVQFKASGKKKYKVVARGLTTSGRATETVKATKSGRYRIVVGPKKSGSDYVRVKR